MTIVTPAACQAAAPPIRRWLRAIDPRWRLAAAVGWAMALVSLAMALFVGLWTMREAREALEREIGLLYATHAQRLIDTIDTNLTGRREWVAASASLIGVREGALAGAQAERALADLKAALHEVEWAGIVDLNGIVVAGTEDRMRGQSVALRPWYTGAFLGAYVGDIHAELLLDRLLPRNRDGEPRRFVDLSAPIIDRTGDIRGVLVVSLGWSWIEGLQRGTLATLKDRTAAEVLLLGIDGTVVVGSRETPRGSRIDLSRYVFGAPYTVTEGQLTGIARSGGFADFAGLGWSVMVREPVASAFRTADNASLSIFGAIAGGGVLATVASAWIASRIMRRLRLLAEAADDLRAGRAQTFAAPDGNDEAGRIGRSIASLVGTLQRANSALDARVAERTREIERLSEESRSAAIVRERLRISRDLHDTVAHTMLALLTQIRLIRKLAAVDPSRLPDELQRAEDAAHEGLDHARTAVSHLRYSPVRDDGFANALRRLAARTQDRTPARLTLELGHGIEELGSGPLPETLYRLIEEALRNAVRHADAAAITVAAAVDEAGTFTAEVRDNGCGFDPMAGQADRFGLTGVHEQADLIGATVAVDSAPGCGTRVRIATRLG